jgi:hypothetical protein
MLDQQAEPCSNLESQCTNNILDYRACRVSSPESQTSERWSSSRLSIFYKCGQGTKRARGASQSSMHATTISKDVAICTLASERRVPEEREAHQDARTSHACHAAMCARGARGEASSDVISVRVTTTCKDIAAGIDRVRRRDCHMALRARDESSLNIGIRVARGCSCAPPPNLE